jgi:poly-gamma-glutamate synthesis protein (capsule biosynthesis protein)
VGHRSRRIAACAALCAATVACAAAPAGVSSRGGSSPGLPAQPVAPRASVAPAAPSSTVAPPRAEERPNLFRAALDRMLAGLPPPRRTFTMAFTGDTLVHSPTWAAALQYGGGQSYDFAPIFARVAPIISSVDLAVCHLESPIAPAGEVYTTAPMYGVPAEIASGLASAGYDRCSTASNHTLDRGGAGVDATVGALEAAGLGQSGMARSAEEAATPAIVDVNGVRVAHLSYTWSFNGLRLRADEPWRSALIDPDRIVADATTARAAGAEYVIVSLHWGTEGSSAISSFQRDVADRITASGVVDLVVGHHAHVLQPIEQVNGRWVVFGMGNFLSSMTPASWPPQVQDGAIVTFRVTERGGGLVTSAPVVVPTLVDRHPYVIRPVQSDLADPSVPAAVVPQLQASLERTLAVLGDYVPAGDVPLTGDPLARGDVRPG